MHLESFRAVRWVRTINLVLQGVLLLTLFAGLNIIALHHHWRKDITRSHRQSLSSETLGYLESLKRPVRVIATFTDDFQDKNTAVVEDVRDMLREYALASASSGNPVTFDFIDPFKRAAEAEALGIREANAIAFTCGDRRRIVTPGELYRIENGERTQFLAEQVFTAALLDVSSTERSKIYFLTGHGELQPDDTKAGGLSVLRDELRMRNFSVELLNIAQAKRIPEDASLVIIAAPDRVEPFAEEQLRQYLRDRAGRALVLLPPRMRHGLTDLLLDWGVLLANNDIIVDSNPDNITPDGNLQINAFAAHPITQTLIDHQLPVIVNLARSVSAVPGNARSGITTTVLAATSPTAWGETSPRTANQNRFMPGDIRGDPKNDNRLGLAIASERVQARGNLTFSVRGGRLVAIGCSDLATNARLAGNLGNQALLLNAVNWAVDRDAQLATPPRPIDKFQLSLSKQQLSRLQFALWFGIPGFVALIGLLVWWTRRS